MSFRDKDPAKWVIVFLLITLLVPHYVLSQDSRPNIIFILTDDQRWDALGFAGNSIIQTPEMDKMAAEGAYFEKAFVTTPICAASRASILTGLYERRHGYTFGQKMSEDFMQLSYPVLLGKAGYHTGFYGKFGVDYDGKDRLFDQWEYYDRNGQFKDRSGYFYKTLEGDSVHLTRYTGQKAMDFIDQAPADQPFCLSLSFSAPHAHDPAELQYFWQEEVDHLYRELDIPSPLMGTNRFFKRQPQFVKDGINRTRWYWRYDTPEKYQHSVKGYYRMISGVDREIGRIRELLQEKQLADNTIIMLMGDNGYFLGERQLAGKWLMYDNSLRVPLIIYDPRQEAGQRVKKMALNIDVPATMMDLAGLSVPGSWQGMSLTDYLQGEEPLKEREDFLSEHLWDIDFIPASEGIRTERWKYFRYRDHPEHEELYDLEKDPHEKKNLASKRRYQAILSQMRTRCDSLIQLNL